MIRSLPATLGRIAGASWLVCLSLGGSATAADKGFSGAVQDALGNLLSDVEVLIIAPTTSAVPVQPLVSVRTNGEGRFLIERLAAGPYQIAAVKLGYRTYIGQVNTKVERWVRLVLQPQSRLAETETPVPDDKRWGLRLPRRNLLRETEAQLEPLRLASRPTTRRPLSDSPVHLQLEQLFKVADDIQRSAADESVMNGIETRVGLEAYLGERAQLTVRGSRERLAGTQLSGSDSRSRDSDRVIAVFSYDPSVDTRLNFEAAYTSRGAEWAPLATPGLVAVDHRQDGFSVAAGVNRQFGATTQLEFRLAYAVSSLQLPADLVRFVPQLSASGSRNSSMDASGSLTRVRSADHQFDLDFDLRYLDLTDYDLRATGSAGRSGFDGLEGLTAGFRAQESWRVGERLSMLYGFGYRQVLRKTDQSLVTPHIGARLNWDRAELKGVATYYGIAGWGATAATDMSAWQPRRRVGYSTTVEFALGDQTLISGSFGFQPLMADRVAPGRREATIRSGPLFVTDGNASLRESRLAFSRDIGTVLVFAELSRGDVDGTVAAWLPNDLPFQQLADRRLGFANGRIGLNFVPAGTQVSLELRDVRETRVEMPQSPSGQRIVELSLSQDLMRRDDLGHWRFLMGLSMAELTAGEPHDLRQIVSTDHLVTTDSRLSAGLSLEF